MFVDDGIRLIDIAIGHFPHTQDCPASQFSAETSKTSLPPDCRPRIRLLPSNGSRCGTRQIRLLARTGIPHRQRVLQERKEGAAKRLLLFFI